MTFGGSTLGTDFVPEWSTSISLCENYTISNAMPVCQACPAELDCSMPGSTFETLTLPEGYWQNPDFFTLAFVQSDGTVTTTDRRRLSTETSVPMVLDKKTLSKEFYVDPCASTTNPSFCPASSGNFTSWTECKGAMTGPLCGICEKVRIFVSNTHFKHTRTHTHKQPNKHRDRHTTIQHTTEIRAVNVGNVKIRR